LELGERAVCSAGRWPSCPGHIESQLLHCPSGFCRILVRHAGKLSGQGFLAAWVWVTWLLEVVGDGWIDHRANPVLSMVGDPVAGRKNYVGAGAVAVFLGGRVAGLPGKDELSPNAW
jgi:hypothetical protein